MAKTTSRKGMQPCDGPPPERMFIEMEEPNVDDVAVTLFSKMYLDTGGREPEYIAERAYRAAEAFMKVCRNRSS